MQCIHFIKIKPIYNDKKDEWTLVPFVKWLKENGITRFCLQNDPWFEFVQDDIVTFKFEQSEDAMAFKLFWEGESE